MKSFLLAACAAFVVNALPIQANAQGSFKPNRPVTLVVPYAPGGGTDAVGRLFAQKLGEMWGQPVIVQNAPGANGSIGSALVAKAAPDGHTLLLSVASLAINPHLPAKLPYNTLKDFTPITVLARPVVVMVASPKLASNDLAAFVRQAKSAPGKLTFASAETSTRMYGERLKEDQGIDIVHIPYKGASAYMADVMSGVIDTGFSSITSALPLLKANRIKILAVLSDHRSPLAADIKTSSEQGIKGLESKSWYGLFGPGRLQGATAAAIYADVSRLLAQQEIKDKLLVMGAEQGGGTPDEFGKRFAADFKEYGALIKSLDIKE